MGVDGALFEKAVTHLVDGDNLEKACLKGLKGI